MVAKQAQIDFLGQFTPVESHTEKLSSIIITSPEWVILNLKRKSVNIEKIPLQNLPWNNLQIIILNLQENSERLRCCPLQITLQL